jgi:hypothetical protein
LKAEVAVSGFAVWTPGGVWVNASPPSTPVEGTLASWPDAPRLTAIHGRARQPHRQAVLLVQLAHVLLSARAAFTRKTPSPPQPSETDLLIGTALGSAEADASFVRGLANRGSGFGSPSTFVYTLPTAAPAEVALALGLRGALATFAAGSISGLFAIARAVCHVGQGRSRACIAGGIELGGTGRGALSHGEGEVAALFLLEPAAPGAPWAHLSDATVGFDPQATGLGDQPLASPLDTMVALARACGDERKQASVEMAAHSQEGYWARVRISGNHRP